MTNVDLVEKVCEKFTCRVDGAERQAVVAALDAAEAYGHGNLISWLATAWAVRLIEKGLDKETAINHVSNRTPYALPSTP